MVEGKLTAVTRLDVAAAQKKLGKLAGGLAGSLRVAMQARVNARIRRVTKDKLRGQYLRRRTGTLIRDVTASGDVVQAGDLLVGMFGTNLGYGIAHERGFAGPVKVPAFERREHFRRGGAKSVRVRAHRVSAHIRNVKIRARHYLADAQKELLPGDEPTFLKSIRILAETGRPAKLSDLGGGGR